MQVAGAKLVLNYYKFPEYEINAQYPLLSQVEATRRCCTLGNQCHAFAADAACRKQSDNKDLGTCRVW